MSGEDFIDALVEGLSRDREALDARIEVDRRDLAVFIEGLVAWKATIEREVA